MGIILVVFGIIWLVAVILKEEVFTTQAPLGTNYRQVTIDLSKGVSAKTVDRRISSGYYVKK